MVEEADRRDPILQQFAREALVHAIAERWEECGAEMRKLNDRYSGDGAVQAALLWIDALHAQLGGGIPSGTNVAVLFQDDTGAVSGADARRSTTVWAGRLMAARMAMDHDTWLALMRVAVDGDTGHTFGAYIGELLHMIALAFRRGQPVGVRAMLPDLPDPTRDECGEELRLRAAAAGAEVTVSTAAPLVETQWTKPPSTCPHGITYWLEPTSDQIARWARDGVE